MRVVIGTVGLAHPGGTETYCLTVAGELDRLGHDVTLFADELGPLAERAAEAGFEIARGEAALPDQCDAVLANDAITARLLAGRYPRSRLVYCLHSTQLDVQLPPLEDGLIDAIVAPSERFATAARALALDVPVIRLAQPIDTNVFVPTLPPRDPPQRALLVSNYLEGPPRDALVETWTAAGVRCVHVGAKERVSFEVQTEMAKADIVVGKARAALEGMACGKAVYVFDVFGSDGWVTGQSYAALEADNFAGQAMARIVDRGVLANDLERYDPDMGWVNRELAVKHHNAQSHAYALVEVLRGPEPPRREQTSSIGATARVVRSAWRLQGRATSLQREVAVLAAERDAWQARALASEDELDSARRDIQSAQELLRTRRVRAGLALGRFLDRMRGKR